MPRSCSAGSRCPGRSPCRAGVCAERSRYRLQTKQGLLFSGDGHARLAHDGGIARVTLDARRTAWWSGEEQQTVASAGG